MLLTFLYCRINRLPPESTTIRLHKNSVCFLYRHIHIKLLKPGSSTGYTKCFFRAFSHLRRVRCWML